ncbi:hypothetical protein IAU60_006334 [Kwoniella sp. DSM 27419]
MLALAAAAAALVPAIAALSVRDNDPVARAQVVILGGGISGISLARSLVQDYNVTDILLIEAHGELGGRAHNQYLTSSDGSQISVEKGCNWIQGPGKEPIQALAEKWGIQTARTNYTDAVYFRGKAGVAGVDATGLRGEFLDDDQVQGFTEGYDNFLDNVGAWREDNMLVDLSVRVGTSIMDWIPVTPMQWLYEWWNIDYTFAQTPEESSLANAFGQEVGLADQADDFVLDQREIFGQGLQDPRLWLNTTVRTIDYSAGDDGDVLVTTDKGTFAANHVISTFSVGVLQHQDVQWVPKLPDWKKEAIFTFAMATYQKIFLMFPTQFWGDEQQARRNEELSDEEIQEEVMQVLKEMYGDDIPQPDDILVPRWTLDPLFRGSYSNWPLGALDQHHSNLRLPVGDNRVHFTGEAMSEEAFGYIQGAWDEGLSTAGVIAACLNGTCPDATAYEALKTCAQDGTVLSRRGRRIQSRSPRRRHS